PGAELVLRAAAGALDPGDLGADPARGGRGLPAADAERCPAAHHDPGARVQRAEDDRGQRDGDPGAPLPQLRGGGRERRIEGRNAGGAAPRLRPVRDPAHLPRDYPHQAAARPVPLPYAYQAGRDRQGERRQGRLAQCGDQREPLPVGHRRGRRHADRARCAAAAYPSLSAGPPDRRGGRHGPGGERVRRETRAGDGRARPAPPAPGHPGGRVPARVPVRPARLESPRRLPAHRRGRKVRCEIPFIPDPVAWTEVPESLRVLARQRERWQRGLVAAMWQYRGMLFNPRYGRVGLIAVPFYAFGEMLAPLVEVFGYGITVAGLALGVVNVPFALLFVLVAWGCGMLLSLWAVVLEEVSFRRYRRVGDLV